MKHLHWGSWMPSLIDDRCYCDTDGDIAIETVDIDGDEVIVVTIERQKIHDWYHEGLDRAVIHIESEPRDSKFF